MENPATTTTTTNNTSDPYKSNSFIGFSLWMVPSQETTLQVYTNLIQQLAHDWKTTSFVPHVTLVAALTTRSVQDVVEKTKQLACQLAPYEFQVDQIQYKDAYFQCVYATMKKTGDVIHANAIARTVFPEKQLDPEYMPHMSLVYGDFSQDEKETKIIPQINAILGSEKDDQATTTATSTIRVDSIQIWSTQGTVPEWNLVETIPLTGSNNNLQNNAETES